MIKNTSVQKWILYGTGKTIAAILGHLNFSTVANLDIYRKDWSIFPRIICS